MERYIKECSQCREEKKLTEFYNNRRRPDGKDNLCKTCRKAKSASAYIPKKASS